MAYKIFTSLPMNGYSPDDIRAEMKWLVGFVSDQLFDEEVELINSYFEEDAPEGTNSRSWYLGKALQAMSEADMVIFHPNWREAHGCVIEHMVCSLYAIPYIEVVASDKSADDEVNSEDSDEPEEQENSNSDDDSQNLRLL